MPTCVPVKDLKDTSRFTQLVQDAPGPITVTRNGYDAFVVMRSRDYDALMAELDKMRLLMRMEQADREYAEGRFSPFEAFAQEVEDAYAQ